MMINIDGNLQIIKNNIKNLKHAITFEKNLDD